MRFEIRKLASEFVGTFAVVFAGTGAIVINEVTHGTISHVGIALTFGLIVLAMIYAVGDVSGCHLNPAVSLAFSTVRRFEARLLLPYVVSQCLGALLGSVTLRILFPSCALLGSTQPAGPELQSLVLEFVLSFLLMFVIISVSTGSKEKGTLAGVAIGSVVAVEAMFAGPICGASMNPARSLAPALVSGHLEHLWIYLIAPVAGAMAGASVGEFVHTKETGEHRNALTATPAQIGESLQ